MADPDYQAQLNAWYANQQKQQTQPFTNNPAGLQNNQNPSVIQQLYDQANNYDVNAVGLKTANDQSSAAAAQGKYYNVEDWKKAYNDGVALGNSQKSLILGKAVDALIKTAQPDPLPNEVQGKLADYDTAVASLHSLQMAYNKAVDNSKSWIFGGNAKATLGSWLHANDTNSSVKLFSSLREGITPAIAQGLGYTPGADSKQGVSERVAEVLPGASDSLPDANSKLYNLEQLMLNRKASLLHEYGFGNYQVANQTKETQDQFADLSKRQLTAGQMYDQFNKAANPPDSTSATPAASPGQPTVQGNNTTATQGFSSQTQNALNGFMQARQAQLQQNPGVNTPVAQGNP
jgi:hypothetical protein